MPTTAQNHEWEQLYAELQSLAVTALELRMAKQLTSAELRRYIKKTREGRELHARFA